MTGSLLQYIVSSGLYSGLGFWAGMVVGQHLQKKGSSDHE